MTAEAVQQRPCSHCPELQSRSAPAVTALRCGAKKCATHNFKKATHRHQRGTAASLISIRGFPLLSPGTRTATTQTRSYDDTLTPPRLSTRLWPGQTPVCRLVTTPQCSNVQCPHPARGPLPCQWSSCGSMKRSVEVLLIFPIDPKAAIPTEGFKL